MGHEISVTRPSEQTSLTYYDTCYLWLAHELGADLVTLDSQLQEAWSV